MLIMPNAMRADPASPPRGGSAAQEEQRGVGLGGDEGDSSARVVVVVVVGVCVCVRADSTLKKLSPLSLARTKGGRLQAKRGSVGSSGDPPSGDYCYH